jgi:hypothetical protein
MELKKAGRIKASILLMARLLLNGIAFFPAFADGEKQDPHKGRDEHYSRAEKEGEDEDDGKERNREKSRGHHKEGADITPKGMMTIKMGKKGTKRKRR